MPTLKYYYPELTFDTYSSPRGDLSEIIKLMGSGRYFGVSWYGHSSEKFREKFETKSGKNKLKETQIGGLFLLDNPSLAK